MVSFIFSEGQKALKETARNDPVPMLPGIFTSPSYDQAGPRLIGALCGRCARKFFPSPFVCPYCLGELEKVYLSNQVTLHSFTVVRVKAPYGLPLPYCLGYVDLKDDGLRVLALIATSRIEDLSIGMEVTLCVKEFGDDGKGNPALRYMFSPTREKRS